MTRLARVVATGLPHHVTQRGNNLEKVFLTDADREFYLSLLKDRANRHELTVIAYCLMPTHVHLLVIPKKQDSLSKTIGTVNYFYSQYFNSTHGRKGHLWQSRFESCALENAYLRDAILCVEQSPMRDGTVALPWEYRWSSAKARVDDKDENKLLDLTWSRCVFPLSGWREVLLSKIDQDIVIKISHHTGTGRPLGGDLFIRELESQLGRRIRLLPSGRPKRKVSNDT